MQFIGLCRMWLCIQTGRQGFLNSWKTRNRGKKREREKKFNAPPDHYQYLHISLLYNV